MKMACAPRCGVEPACARLIAVACGHRLRHGTGWAGSYLVCSKVCVVGSSKPTSLSRGEGCVWVVGCSWELDGWGWWWEKTTPNCVAVWLDHTDRQMLEYLSNPSNPSQTHVVGTGWVRVTNLHPVPAPAVTHSTNPHRFINPWHSLTLINWIGLVHWSLWSCNLY